MLCGSSELVKDLPMEALGDALRPSMLGPSSGSGEESVKKQFGPKWNSGRGLIVGLWNFSLEQLGRFVPGVTFY